MDDQNIEILCTPETQSAFDLNIEINLLATRACQVADELKVLEKKLNYIKSEFWWSLKKAKPDIDFTLGYKVNDKESNPDKIVIERYEPNDISDILMKLL